MIWYFHGASMAVFHYESHFCLTSTRRTDHDLLIDHLDPNLSLEDAVQNL